MQIKKHDAVLNIRKQLLLRVGYITDKLLEDFTYKSLARYYGCSTATIYRLRTYTGGRDEGFPISNFDRIFHLCELLRIEYTFTVKSIKGITRYEFTSPTVVGWVDSSTKPEITNLIKNDII